MGMLWTTGRNKGDEEREIFEDVRTLREEYRRLKTEWAEQAAECIEKRKRTRQAVDTEKNMRLCVWGGRERNEKMARFREKREKNKRIAGCGAERRKY
jgi:hypothetical protein